MADAKLTVKYVRRNMSLADRLAFHSVRHESGCLIWTGSTGSGNRYGQLRWLGKMRAAHRLSWINTHGAIPDGMHVLHRCDNPSCVEPSHLFLGTHVDNMRDMMSKERAVKPPRFRGEGAPWARLTEVDIIAIRQDRRFHREIAAAFGICRSHVGDIKNFKKWGHV